MKNKSNFLIKLVSTIILSSVVFAHPPSKVNLSVSSNVLAVIADHEVKQPKKHFIYEITVKLNRKDIISQTLSEQIGHTQSVSYTIPSLKKGDQLTVQASCNKFGSKKATLVIK
ncbi:MAG: hypothetical protein A2Y40_05965 [Candidatus Margulisbacteria bacterium GWF2_35_9]|nr:MAG: hypothetical protein A2Y40_05965 [Candidatus Margulisbacteria bacterium GWF2_35_9]